MAKPVSLTEIRNALGGMRDELTNQLVKDFTKLGYEAIMFAYQRRGFKHRSRNLHDSYGSAVYVRGNLIRSSIRYVGGEVSRGEDPHSHQTGRQALHEFLESNRFYASQGDIVVVCVAAMYYAQYLEQGRHRGAYEIQVISAARDYLDYNWPNFISPQIKSFVVKGVRPKSGTYWG